MLFIKTMSQMSEDNQKLLLNLIQNLSNKDSDKKEDDKKKKGKKNFLEAVNAVKIKKKKKGVEILENASYEDVFEQLQSMFKSLELKK